MHSISYICTKINSMLEHFFIATAYATLIVLFLASGTLFACRKHGDRSRIILACIFLLTVAIYSFKMERFFEGSINAQITSVPMLTLTFFSIISFIIYPIEVISPGWFNKRRLLLFYLPIPIIIGIYFLSVAFGITYTEYTSLKEMLPFAFQFNVLFRLTICLAMFLPLFFVFFIPHTRIYSNADKTWIQIYTSSFAIILLSCLSYVVYQGYCPGHSLYIICQVNCYGLLYIKFKPEFNSIVIILYTILLVE